MFEYLWLIPALPLGGFLVLLVGGRRFPRTLSGVIGVGSVAFAAVLTILLGLEFLISPPPDYHYLQLLWSWMSVGDFHSEVGLYLDALSMVMIFVVTYIGFLIHYYSFGYMKEDPDFSRFFCYMNLFVFFMLVLVLADNLVLLLLGWEGVGLCSYLLIGFWYKNPVNGKAAIKAFVVTRIGDVAFLVAIFVIFTSLRTVDIQQLMERAGAQWQMSSSIAVWTAMLLLIGAIGKSAQLPLQVWLPDAMAGPTPVSALIHAATMVAAGVYLVARLNGIFVLAPSIQEVIAILGAATILVAGLSALAQEDLKRILAYSTISQLGYMFLALGVGAWSAAIYHFLSHAFFKSLLFLCAGAVIMALEEGSVLRMGGLRKKLPLVFWVFLVGALTTAGIPPTAGFASKDLILYWVWRLPAGGALLWVAAVFGVFVTALYSFRMVFRVFFGETKKEPVRKADFSMGAPLAVLAAFCFLVALLDWPSILDGLPLFTGFMQSALPPMEPPQMHLAEISLGMEAFLEVTSVGAGLLGIFFAWLFFIAKPQYLEVITSSRLGALLHRLLFAGWGFDWLYNNFIVAPYVWITRKNRKDFIDRFYDGVALVMENVHGLLSLTQNGNLRWYAMSIMIGAIIFMAVIIFS